MHLKIDPEARPPIWEGRPRPARTIAPPRDDCIHRVVTGSGKELDFPDLADAAQYMKDHPGGALFRVNAGEVQELSRA